MTLASMTHNNTRRAQAGEYFERLLAAGGGARAALGLGTALAGAGNHTAAAAHFEQARPRPAREAGRRGEARCGCARGAEARGRAAGRHAG